MPEAILQASERDIVTERNELRTRVEQTLEFLSRQLPRPTSGDVAAQDIQEAVAFLGQVLAAWPQVPDDAFPDAGAGFGDTIVVEDLETRARDEYTLMNGPMLDFDAGHVSLASPIGQALLGVEPGAVVTIQLPQRLRRLRVVRVNSLVEKLGLPASARRAS